MRLLPAVVLLALVMSCSTFGQPYTIYTVAGNGGFSALGDNGPATSASLDSPSAVAMDSAGNLYIADTENNRIRKVSNGVITTVAGIGPIGGTGGFSGDGGPATNAQLNAPYGVAVDSSGNIYIADTDNHRIRKVSNGVITTVAGNGYAGFYGDGGPATNAQLFRPFGVAVDTAGNLYIADQGNNAVRKISNGAITTVAGNGYGGYSGDNGPATSAELAWPTAVVVDSAGALYIADALNNVIRKVSNGVITTVAGNGVGSLHGGAGSFSGDNGPATSAGLWAPQGVAVDSAGNLYIADSANERVRKVSNGVITTVAGNGGCCSFIGDGGPATSAQLGPMGLVVDSSGNLYIADGNNRIRKATPATAPSITITGAGVSGGGANIAQNAWTSIYGTNLAPASDAGGLTWSTAPSFASFEMPTSLDGVSVTVNGKPAYVSFICPTQINVLTPLDSTTGPVAVVVNNGTATGAAYTANLQAVSPGFLRFGDFIHIVAQHADYSFVGPASMSVPGYTFTPAVPGEVIALYGDGFGLPVTTLTAGSMYQSGALPEYPQITIGGVASTVQYAAVISPGLYQINVLVPAVPASGDNQVIATYDGVSSPTGAMIPVSQ